MKNMPVTKHKKNYSKSKRKEVLEVAYRNNEKYIYKIVEFLNNNKKYRKQYTINSLETILSNSKHAKQKLRVLFINAINAAGGNNLTKTGKAAKKYYKIIDKLPDTKLITLKKFFAVLSNELHAKMQNFSDFNKHLVKQKSFENFSQKKIALFIRDIHATQFSKRIKIFTGRHIRNDDLIIPVDVVIVDVLNKMLGLRGNKVLNPGRDFKLINDFFKEKLHKNKFMLIEDLWFWGYFNSVKKIMKNDKSIRKIKFNEDKYYSNKFMYPDSDVEKKLKHFGVRFRKLFLRNF